MFNRLFPLLLAAAVALSCPLAAQTQSPHPVVQESTFWADEVARGLMPPATWRIPQEPLVVDLEAKGRSFGTQGGTLRTMISRSKDVRQMVVYGYARLVGYDHKYNLKPDILRDVTVEDGRRFTLHLREGHKWSDGSDFTSADFDYWWNHVANNPELSPNGPPDVMRVGRQLATMSFPDRLTVVVEWPVSNPEFLQQLAAARPPFIYRPSTYLKQFHVDFADPAILKTEIDKRRVRGWAALHNRIDNMYKFDNPALPTLQPWMSATATKSTRQLYVRNPYFHRIDARGVQLPYIDVVEMTVVGAGLVAAKSNAGETDLQARGLDFNDVAILKKGESDGANYHTLLWGNGAASQIAIYPNLNFADPVWREVIRDVRFRRALSMGIDRHMINRALYFGLGQEGGMAALAGSAFFSEANLHAWASYDPDAANALLDEMGLTERTPSGLRKLPDGRPMEFVIETAGERQEVENALAIITDTWREIGIKLVMRPLDRDILRNRVYAGVTMAAVWYGWDNGLPQPYTPPGYLAPTQQDFMAWPMWGQYYQTRGAAGEAVNMPQAKRLLVLSAQWTAAKDDATRSAIWREMLEIHASEQYGIGILAEAPQPVVVNNTLRNVPEAATWAWEPGAHFGVHRMDEFWFDLPTQTAQVSK
ncbi:MULTISPECIES: ABC transporter substrate-binding protein [Roseobacteraceae]|uniref:Putative ABC transporter-binding protein n=1 Tax=Pseudosulfitobacter pseudonitzschiae TaxID=1402135 RepID=A0A221JWH2_9RHOB|nr:MULTISPECIES: ABC transporter substrate-binding protein [Roseobacteraceae]ASM71085.1 putative ABC transporter-binding protein [Pseudosulfitobacter pseudonitzschiae]